MNAAASQGFGIGRSVPRREDDRYLRGRGEFIADIRLAGMLDRFGRQACRAQGVDHGG